MTRFLTKPVEFLEGFLKEEMKYMGVWVWNAKVKLSPPIETVSDTVLLIGY